MTAPSNSLPRAELAKLYGDEFYRAQVDKSLISAKKYAGILWPLHAPQAVVDVGCGRGTWLKAFKDLGASVLVGYDGPWNSHANMIDPSIEFSGVDLNNPLARDTQRFDLAMSVEVAEHLEPSSAAGFVKFLTAMSDVVLFGAAFTKQGGTNHINEQPHSYWARIFAALDYHPYDLFRPILWGNEDVEFWYQQNTFLYVRVGTPVTRILQGHGLYPVENIHFLDCVHPVLYEDKIKEPTKRELIRKLAARSLPKALMPFAKRVRGFIE